ncbi:GntR family transcriptional regulator [Kitasatospora sp. NPDC051705]|uniref:GntR family transcriptional regulator n=1 Tax=Kitasatospora sp. NPDC051705 TaxID=3364057 RepID=UPI00379A6970
MTLPLEDDARPPYVQAADALRMEIEAGRYKPGERLPSARALQEQYGLASSTVQNALRLLKDEGYIYAVQGRGSYVRTSTPEENPIRRAGREAFQRYKREADERREAEGKANGGSAKPSREPGEAGRALEAGGETVEVSAADLATLTELVTATQTQVMQLRQKIEELEERVERAEQAAR